MTPPHEPRRVLHPRDLLCPRCGAGVDRPCSFAGHVQKEIHCTERLLALGDPALRVEAAPEPPTKPPPEKPPAPERPKKRRPLPPAPSGRKPAAPEAQDDAPLTLFG
ncbi:hypothetical protein GBA63_22385 (plasmid) [Rubrobacter tropicus]|uniref:C2H2-type domain-containing protein n=1 Tax=Rubrobacter tropicus TaxID=2653851 RepID=A0A6G8QG71_9ACTN|nr:hypothetical protein [Rubrobacter tropicus]QIN85452.1 hypothetical protein GBA63_22385 [Rubrobacter tropicus]